MKKEPSAAEAAEAVMISRRKILSRSRDELNVDFTVEDEEDVWYQKEKLFKDHIQEVLNKWDQIDDEIWAKIICMERNRRVAKAYARAPVLTINGSNEGFDGFRIGLCGFDNPMRDPRTEELKKQVGHGVKIKMDDGGNIMIKRVSKSNVYVKEISGGDNSSVSSEIIRNNGLLELEKPVKVSQESGSRLSSVLYGNCHPKAQPAQLSDDSWSPEWVGKQGFTTSVDPHW